MAGPAGAGSDAGITKGLVIVLVWLMGFMGVILPLRFRSEETTLSYATLFSAGVILSVAMCHLLPDASETLAESTDYPLSNFFCCLGLFAVLIVEKVFAGQHEAIIAALRRASRGSPTFMAHHSDTDEEVPCLASSGYCKDPLPVIGYGTTEPPRDDCNVSDHHHHLSYTSKIFRQGLESGVSLSQHMAKGSPRPCEHAKICDPEDCHANPVSGVSVSFTEKPTGMWVAVTVLLVLSFHSVIEGLALGTAQGEKSILLLTVAILSHKFLAAVSLGISLFRAEIDPATHVWYAIIFSCMTPAGSALGYIIADLFASSTVSVFAAVCQSLGSGTFIYISLMEFIPEELHGDALPTKLMSCFTGFLLMAAVAIVV